MTHSARPDRPTASAELLPLAEAMQAARTTRAAAFPNLVNQIADPTWDILLFLFIAHERGERVMVTQACDSTQAGRATAIRHIRTCEQYGYVTRDADITDRRRVFLLLSPIGLTQMRRYLGSVSLTPAPGRSTQAS
jgi:DNA-binding MarR family transcriptional regulator